MSLLKQLSKKFPLEREFFVCCCYSNYCFPNGTIAYKKATLTPIIWSNYPVSHYQIWNGKITKSIMTQWNLPLPEEHIEEMNEIILIKDWCQTHHINFHNLITIDKENEGYCFNKFLNGNRNEIELCNKLNINYNFLLENGCYEATDFIIEIFKIMFPNHKLHFYKQGNMIYPHYLQNTPLSQHTR